MPDETEEFSIPKSAIRYRVERLDGDADDGHASGSYIFLGEDVAKSFASMVARAGYGRFRVVKECDTILQGRTVVFETENP